MQLSYDIQAPSAAVNNALQNKIDQKTKPLGSLGLLEALALHIGRIKNSLTPHLNNPSLLIFASDHCIAGAGVSFYPQTFTVQMVANFLNSGAAINIFARQHQLELLIIETSAQLPFLKNKIKIMLINQSINFKKNDNLSVMQSSFIDAGVKGDLYSLHK